MIILAFDSTARVASVAVTDGDRPLGKFDIDNGLTHSELLLPMAESLLEKLKISINDIELLAATVGPGSFTGVSRYLSDMNCRMIRRHGTEQAGDAADQPHDI